MPNKMRIVVAMYSKNKYIIVDFQLNGSTDGMMLDALPGM